MTEIRIIDDVVVHVLAGKDAVVPALAPTMSLNGDLGITSLDFALVAALLEAKLGVDPFASGVVASSVRTLADLYAAYDAR
jgi:hypothetical protein